MVTFNENDLISGVDLHLYRLDTGKVKLSFLDDGVEVFSTICFLEDLLFELDTIKKYKKLNFLG